MPEENPTDHPAIEIGSLSFSWPGRKEMGLSIDALSLGAGQSLFLSGPSGCGKSTLLSIIAGVVEVPHGKIRVAGQDLGSLSAHRRDRFRADHIGLVFQVFNLLPWQSALKNVLLACRFSERRRQRAGPDPQSTAIKLLHDLGLRDSRLISAPAAELSIGQQQRVAAARALIGAPDLILADEPTSALDEDTKAAFLDLLMRQCAKTGSALLFVSHDRSLARHFDRSVSLPKINRATMPC